MTCTTYYVSLVCNFQRYLHRLNITVTLFYICLCIIFCFHELLWRWFLVTVNTFNFVCINFCECQNSCELNFAEEKGKLNISFVYSLKHHSSCSSTAKTGVFHLKQKWILLLSDFARPEYLQFCVYSISKNCETLYWQIKYV